ncbi:unnamed protein product [Caenorhabditis bovis]|uniref:Peptidase C1A papain C-terminal domain-containing protein n=1 Tax=Caenorhabditis bovis TaxID=2654633 RepID=A0A8S1EGG5_9PELO|nr:unnamed protein product [Caenorhabditis bovis]
MKLLLTIVIALAARRSYSSSIPDVSKISGVDLVEYVNRIQDDFVVGLVNATIDEMRTKVMLSRYADAHSDETLAGAVDDVADAIPDAFDAREHLPNCASIRLIRDQTNCGACWAFAAAEVMSDRVCIATRGARQPILSAEDALACCGQSCGLGCSGGYLIKALEFFNRRGVVTGGDYLGGGCKPYTVPPCDHAHCKPAETPQCHETCQSGYSKSFSDDKHFGKSAYAVAKTVAAIQTEIMTNGPVSAAITVHEDFYKYKSGVYHHVAGPDLGGHAIKIIGWGSENGNDYWLAANSWGSGWGEDGFFRFRRGVDECGIESGVVAGLV